MKINLCFKFLISLLLIIMIINIFMPFTTLAVHSGFMDPKQFDNASYNKLTDTELGSSGLSIGKVTRNLLSTILAVVRTIALGWAILMAVSIATKYMTGSPHIKSQLKTDMPTYVIGAAILFGAAGIITLVKYFVDDKLV